MIDVSVVIPVYNQELYIEQAVKSCYANKVNVEVVVLDDGSTDQTWGILEKLCLHHPSLKIMRQEHTGNMGKTLDKLYRESSGKYICELGSDDYLLPHSLDFLFNEIEKTEEIGLVYSGYYISENEKIIGAIPHPDNKYYHWINNPEQRLLENNFVAPPCLVRRALYEQVQYDVTQELNEDYLFKLELSRVTKFRQVKKILSVIRKRPNSITYEPTLFSSRKQWDNMAREKVIKKYGR